MSDLDTTPELPTDDAAFAAFDKLLIQDAPASEPVPEPVKAVAEPPAEPAAPADPAKPQKRTAEGRFASIQAQIDERVREREEVRRQLDADRAELARLSAEKAKYTAPAKPAGDDPEPDPADTTKYPDGQFDRQFYKDQARWEAKQILKDAETRRQSASLEQQYESFGQTQMQTLNTKIAAAEKDVPAFLASLSEDVRTLTPSGMLTAEGRRLVQTPEGRELAVKCAIADRCIKSDNSVAMLRYLSDNPRDLQRLSTLPPDDLFWEMGKLDASLGTATARPSPAVLPISQAKPPIKPMGSEPQTTDDLELRDDLDFAEFKRRGDAAEKRRR